MDYRLSPKIVMEKVCLDKKQYSKERADEYVDAQAKWGLVLYYYKCKFCSSYHMSRQDSVKNDYIEVIGGKA